MPELAVIKLPDAVSIEIGVAHVSRDACDAVLYDAVHAAGPPHTGALFLGLECTPAVRDPNFTYYMLGAAIELPLINEQ